MKDRFIKIPNQYIDMGKERLSPEELLLYCYLKMNCLDYDVNMTKTHIDIVTNDVQLYKKDKTNKAMIAKFIEQLHTRQVVVVNTEHYYTIMFSECSDNFTIIGYDQLIKGLSPEELYVIAFLLRRQNVRDTFTYSEIATVINKSERRTRDLINDMCEKKLIAVSSGKYYVLNGKVRQEPNTIKINNTDRVVRPDKKNTHFGLVIDNNKVMLGGDEYDVDDIISELNGKKVYMDYIGYVFFMENKNDLRLHTDHVLSKIQQLQQNKKSKSVMKKHEEKYQEWKQEQQRAKEQAINDAAISIVNDHGVSVMVDGWPVLLGDDINLDDVQVIYYYTPKKSEDGTERWVEFGSKDVSDKDKEYKQRLISRISEVRDEKDNYLQQEYVQEERQAVYSA